MTAAATILSWNVNGIRSAEKKGFPDWLQKEKPAVLAVQETKARPDQLSDALVHPAGYDSYWSYGQRPGYSGVAVYSQVPALRTDTGFNVPRFDGEGRILIAEYERFILFNIYFPNGKSNAERLGFKLDFYREFFNCVKSFRRKKKTIIVCGDFNTAHQEIDLARPRENSTVSGFLPQERALLDVFIEQGFIDTFRFFCKDPGRYTWWDLKSRARDRNVGWRIDYFFIDKESIGRVQAAFILDQVRGSDHCPVGITLKD